MNEKFNNLRELMAKIDQPPRVLFADDNDALRQVMQYHFTESNVHLKAVATAEEAIEILEKEEYDLVILDFQFDNGKMDGIEAFRLIRTKNKKLPVVFLTGYADHEGFKRLPEIGWATIIRKPLDTEQLEALISVFTGKGIVHAI